MKLNNSEKLNKIVIVIIAISLLLTVGILFKKNSKKNIIKKSVALQVKKMIDKVETSKANIKKIENKVSPNRNIITPTAKYIIIKNARVHSGRNDPFAFNSKMVAKKATQDDALLPPAPEGSIAAPKVYKDGFAIKGFIADKVIVSINGIEESLGEKERFQDLKVYSIDPDNMSAKFIKRGKLINKKMEQFEDNNSQIDIIRY